MPALEMNFQIQRVDGASLTPEVFFHDYQKTGVPVVITGLIQECDWDLEYLCENLGEQRFLLRSYGKERYQQDKRQWVNIGSGVDAQNLPFTEFAKMLRNRQAHEKDIYLAKCSIQNTPLAQTQSFHLGAKLGLNEPVSDLNIWIGPSGHVESLHYDPVDGTLMQLHGAKKVVLFPPSQLSNLYPFPIYIHLRHGLKLRSWFSQVYPEKPNFQSFPKLEKALKYKIEVILNRGEILYIPSGWWHEVTALGDEMVCSVNRFWRIRPVSRFVFSWSKWRTLLGFLLAVPYILFSLAIAIFSRDRKQKIRKIWQML
ncbi:cupin-like domain-containing protein [Iningainema tapete]|uniref:Cupin-like domain-containing protein n=1 Tax=Iningainema tapete BLCC-T55 TaxID=2748662 RepID=A0A8J7C951_9CYAN|nr:cupin-like domain-containing protein [Iningainema tapete]MBD2777689.1 cupin-like domain-containing protein [Iningainema tapete BLCC-T55]